MLDRRLHTFIAAAESGSFARAADKLVLTPASVLNQINALEDEVGAKLFERTNRGVLLTASGETFYRDAKRIAAELEEAVSRAREAGTEARCAVRIGTSLLNPAGVLIDLLGRSGGAPKNMEIRIVPFEDDRSAILSVISSLGGEIDIIVGSCNSVLWQERCNVRKIGEYSVCCAVPASHRLASATKLRAEDLRGERLMIGKRGDSDVIDVIRDMFEKNYPDVEIADAPIFYDADVFNKSEHAGCVLLTLDAWANVHPSLVTIPVDWDYSVPYGLLFSKTPSRGVKMFLEHLGL